jgi:3-phenylpropionate/trans-cinnamate dioxygenase ferredoxin subunit
MAAKEKVYVTVAKTMDLPPGERMVVELGRKWIVIFNINGEYYALEDVCSHDEVALSDGMLHDNYTIECSAHGACFDVRTGAVKAAPALSPVKRFDMRIEGDDLQIATS